MDPRVGTEFAGHRIESVIGRGGASVVYLAEHLRLGRKVALKVLAPHLADDQAFRERFIRESRIAAGLDHPNVVTVYDAGEVEGSLYISMRYVEGSDLGRLLAAGGALEPARTIWILAQIASALDAAHAQGLVHRDVKPANMLVEPTAGLSDHERAYLSDFGISKRTTSREGLTRTGQFVGTVDYVAPEQITGEPVDGRTDVYSLGCVLYECLTGHVPFPGETGVATIYSHLHDAPPAIRGFEAHAPGLGRAVSKALAKSKEARFDTCAGLIEAVRTEFAGTAPTVQRARPEPPGDDRRDGAPRHRDGGSRRRSIAVSAGGVVLAVAVVTLALVLPGDGRDPGSSTGPTGTTSGSTGPTETSTPAVDPPEFFWSRAYATEGTNLAGAAIIDAAVSDDGVVLAVGHAPPSRSISALDNAAAWRSDDGRTWHRVGRSSLEQEGDQRMIAVAFFGGLLVAGGWSGSDAGLWTSDDLGDTWVRSQDPDLGGTGAQRIRDFVALGDTLVAVGATGLPFGQDAAAWVSPDGLDWSPMDSSAFEAVGDDEIFAVHALRDRLVAVGISEVAGDIDGAIWGYQGGDWTRFDPEELDEPGDQVMLDIAGGSGNLPMVIVGCEDPADRCDNESATQADAVVWTSEDGSSWERATEGGRLTGEGDQVMRALVTYQGDLVAVGSRGGPLGDVDGGVWTSADGIVWRAPTQISQHVTALGGPGDQTMRAVAVYGSRGITLFGFGVETEGEQVTARVWSALRVD